MADAKKRKSAQKRVEITGRDATSQLYRAVRRYVETRGGNIVVIGGVQVQQWPTDARSCFYLAVKCSGSAPKKPQRSDAEAPRE